jgi:hypothetical protein
MIIKLFLKIIHCTRGGHSQVGMANKNSNIKEQEQCVKTLHLACDWVKKNDPEMIELKEKRKIKLWKEYEIYKVERDVAIQKYTNEIMMSRYVLVSAGKASKARYEAIKANADLEYSILMEKKVSSMKKNFVKKEIPESD